MTKVKDLGVFGAEKNTLAEVFAQATSGGCHRSHRAACVVLCCAWSVSRANPEFLLMK